MKPSAFKDVTRLDLLPPGNYIAPTVLEDCEDAWNEQAPTGCTITAGTTNKVEGTNCVKIAMIATAVPGIIASEVLSSTDLTLAKYITMWIMCTRGINAGDLQFVMDDSVNCATPVKTLDIPAIRAGVMNYVILPVGAFATGQNAIISVGLKMVTDLGICDVYVDAVKFCVDQPLIGGQIDLLEYEDDIKLVLSVGKQVAGTTKTLDVAIQESDYLYDSFAALSPALAFTQITTVMGTEEKIILAKKGKRYIKAVATMGSADCAYALALHGYGIKKTLG